MHLSVLKMIFSSLQIYWNHFADFQDDFHPNVLHSSPHTEGDLGDGDILFLMLIQIWAL